ncbi:helix-turn-helix domain-containing protein [Microterricola viridarii]|uniref:Helix-turn-helix domain-containing protein n=1 Tax=Microterricola viridarii TaxID=412690 RepID=A0A120I101_9MICO|nr:helix-turn-helix domain-containing protein [Microterricola viridarii]AMB58248.1 hypothetical protein AWU67_04595 [Microterricola viridarii]
MSWQAAEWMDGLPYDIAKPLATRVLLKLANVAAQDGSRAWRNVWEVANELGVDKRSVQRALRELLADDLIRVGDQRAVHHIRADRRPVVYDLNFDYERLYSPPEIPLPDDTDEAPENGASHGVTEFSTGGHGVTNGVTTEVPLGTKGTNYLTNDDQRSYVPERAQAHEVDGSADTHQPAGATAADACPRWLYKPHSFRADGKCIDCPAERAA